MDKKYPGLRITGTIYKVLGIIMGIITILAVIGICLTSILGGAAMDSFANSMGGNTGVMGSLGGVLGGLIGGFLALLYGGAMSLGLYAFGEMMHLMVAMEENTRATVALLQKRITSQEAGAPQR